MHLAALFLGFALAERAFLAIGILSNAPNFERRQVMRETWLQERHEIAAKIKIVFLVGRCTEDDEVNKKVRSESAEHGDIYLMENHPETYRGIMAKTKQAFLWAFGGEGADFLFKCDDDVYTKLGALVKLLSWLKEIDPAWRQLYMGRMLEKKPPIREPGHRWFISTKEWPQSLYPTYACGSGYLVACGLGDLIVKGEAKELLDQTIAMEDVTVGIWMQSLQEKYKQKINFRNEDGIQHGRTVPCIESDFMASPFTAEEMRTAFLAESICI